MFLCLVTASLEWDRTDRSVIPASNIVCKSKNVHHFFFTQVTISIKQVIISMIVVCDPVFNFYIDLVFFTGITICKLVLLRAERSLILMAVELQIEIKRNWYLNQFISKTTEPIWKISFLNSILYHGDKLCEVWSCWLQNCGFV